MRQEGLSLIEILISLGLGAFMLVGIISLVASVSSTRSRLSETSNQIENGRYAMQLFNEEVSLAGFYGLYHPGVEVPPPVGTAPNIVDYTAPDPCDSGATLANLGFNNTAPVDLPLPVVGYPVGSDLPDCLDAHGVVANSEVLVLHRVGTTPVTVDATAIPNANTTPYLQISDCSTEASDFVFSKTRTDLVLTGNDCATVSVAWPYQARTFFIASCEDCSGAGDGRSTLKVLEYMGGSLSVRSLVSGIEDIHFSYGLDLDVDGSPDCYTDDPSQDSAPAACTVGTWSAVDAENWEDLAAVRVTLLVRGEEPVLSSASGKTYDMGRASRVGPFSDRFKRQVVSSVIVLPNVAGPRE